MKIKLYGVFIKSNLLVETICIRILVYQSILLDDQPLSRRRFVYRMVKADALYSTATS